MYQDIQVDKRIVFSEQLFPNPQHLAIVFISIRLLINIVIFIINITLKGCSQTPHKLHFQEK
jgi:hypothetical protein